MGERSDRGALRGEPGVPSVELEHSDCFCGPLRCEAGSSRAAGRPRGAFEELMARARAGEPTPVGR